MATLKSLWKKDPGLVVSGGAHALVVVFLLVNSARPPKFEEAIETVPVEMITTSDLNQIMNGEKTAKQMPKPQRRVDKVADLKEHKPAPPLAEAKKDTPPPPSPEKANDDPGHDEKPPEPVAAQPPTPVPPPPVQAPMPPERPVAKVEPPKPDQEPEKPDAEALAPKPPPRPKDPPKKDAKEEAKPLPVPHPRPVETKVAKVVPPQPPQKRETLDQVAKLLANLKPPKPVTKQRAGNEATDSKHNDFSLDKITALLDHEAPQRKASTGHALTQMASLGAPNSHAEKMSPSMMAQLDGWLIDHYRGCWSYFGLGATQDYVPSVRVKMAEDGSLIGQPQLLNPPSDPNLRSLADSAIRAVNRCNPMDMPARFRPFYDSWRQRVVRFDPKEMS